jgi:cytochrome c
MNDPSRLDGGALRAHCNSNAIGGVDRMIRVAALSFAMAFGLVLPAAAQNADAGQRVFNQCRACHTINEGGRNGVGPNLHGVIGRQAGAIEGFRYSAPLRAKAEEGLVWDEAALRAYIGNPKAVIPGGSMSYPGLRSEQQMNDLIAYLKANG